MPAGATGFATMKPGSNAWLYGQYMDQDAEGRSDDIGRLAYKSQVELDLLSILERSEDKEISSCAGNALIFLEKLFDASEKTIARHEARGKWDKFRLRHRMLAGQALELSHLAERQPEQPCDAFKARQLNLVLRPLKEEMEENMGVPLGLVSEDGENTYSDVSLMLRIYQDVGAAYVRRHYNGNPPKLPEVPENWATSLIQDQILTYCMDQPRSIWEIGALLGYKDKKTTRKYLNPLLRDGLLARTVPDKPNSRNQKYLTARNV